MKKSPWFTILVYISVAFLALSLAKANYLFIPEISNWKNVLSSFVVLCAGFIANALPWREMLKRYGYPVSFNQSIISIGLSIFAKYIPGKVWMIVGRAGYIAEACRYPTKSLGLISLDTQAANLWTGLALGLIGILLVNGWGLWGKLTCVLLLLFSLFLFTNLFHVVITRAIKLASGRRLTLSRINNREIMAVSHYFLLQWLLWCYAFGLLTSGLVSASIPAAGLGFALAASVGIISVISPGGIGVRESILTGYLVIAGLRLDEAVTVATFSRLWFLCGECFLFLVALFLKPRPQPKNDATTVT